MNEEKTKKFFFPVFKLYRGDKSTDNKKKQPNFGFFRVFFGFFLGGLFEQQHALIEVSPNHPKNEWLHFWPTIGDMNLLRCLYPLNLDVHMYGKHAQFLGCLSYHAFECPSAPHIMMVTLTPKDTPINIWTITAVIHITCLGVEGSPRGSHAANYRLELLLRVDRGKKCGILYCRRRKVALLLGSFLDP